MGLSVCDCVCVSIAHVNHIGNQIHSIYLLTYQSQDSHKVNLRKYTEFPCWKDCLAAGVGDLLMMACFYHFTYELAQRGHTEGNQPASLYRHSFRVPPTSACGHCRQVKSKTPDAI